MATYAATADRYSKPAKFFHWLIFLLVALAWLSIEVRGPKGTDSRVFWSNVHFWAGSLVLSLATLRLLWRLWHGAPAEIDSKRLFAFLSRLVHLMLYLFIFVQPLLGILMINAAGHPVALQGVDLQITLIGADPIAREIFKNAHELIGNVFYWVVGLHALAAIAHHFVLRDNTLRRMI
ncbi:cytochrome b [Paraburkholderia dinghuensis]|uniref:Cytochrome b n=1 Tax=Paraburkholderia dinghuensis TaxID=2305225 RepID=A0A3N6PZM9_9BURK|nr:cytochrome b [Paraburkholderia dinghuensis]RQH05446.1 cytochrome b [Paraburkholderia dinghuensis]